MIDHNLETARKIANLTQNELAEKAGVKRSKIAMVETGERELFASEIKKIAAVLGITPCFLLSDKPEEEFKCDKGNLGFSAPTVETIKNMDEEVRVAFEYLINDPTFGLAVASYFFGSEDEGIHRNGEQIAEANDEVILGSGKQYNAGWKVDDLIDEVMRIDIAATLLNIRRRIRR